MSRPARLILASAFALAGCSLGPDYQTPPTTPPAAFKEIGEWKDATPLDALPKGAWWAVFGDATLNAQEDRLGEANQDLKIAAARLAEARAAAQALSGETLPQVEATAASSRGRTSKTTASPLPFRGSSDHRAAVDFSYEIDLWGRVRNSVEAGQNRAQASAADLAAVDLSLRAELASDYFSLRGADIRQAVLDQAVESYDKALALTRSRHQGGVAAEIDVDQAEAQLESAHSDAEDNRLVRAQLEHAIAILTGAQASDFSLTAEAVLPRPPLVAPGLPSQLLERRPDVAAAERRVAAANADIKVARAAFFPVFSLSGLLGFESATPGKWLQAPSAVWALGGAGALTLFDNGRRQAFTDEARAAFDEAAAGYRRSVLTADREVEDNLTALRLLEREAVSQAAAVAAANRALAQAESRYRGGLSTYLEVVTRQNAALSAQLAETSIQTRRLVASVLLVKALGGGWQPQQAALP